MSRVRHSDPGFGPGKLVQVAEFPRHDLHGHFARDLTGGMATHAIRDDEQPSLFCGVSEEGVFIPRAHHAHVTAGCYVHIH